MTCVDHDHLFFKANGTPIRNLQYPYTRWRWTIARLGNVRYRKPYSARHTSVSWDLMTGRSALWVARQHGHSISTMLRFYAAWTDGASESDIVAIRAAMADERPLGRGTASEGGESGSSRSTVRPFEMESAPTISMASAPDSFASEYANGHGRPWAKCSRRLRKIGGRERDSIGPAALTQGQMTYQLRRLRLHGLIERMPRTQRYQLTDDGRRVALFCSRLYARAIRPGLALIDPQAWPSDHGLQRAFKNLDHQVRRFCQQEKLAA